MRFAVDLMSAVVEFLVLNYSFNIMLQNKNTSKLLKLIFGILFILINLTISTFALQSKIVPALFICSVLIYSFIYKERMIKRLLYSFLFYIFAILSEMLSSIIVSSLNDVLIAELQENTFLFALALILSKLLLLFSFRLIGFFKSDNGMEIGLKSVLPILLIETSNIVCICYLAMISRENHNIISSISIFIIIIVIIFANIATFYLLENQIQYQKTKNSVQNIQAQYKLQKEYYSELRENMLVTNSNTHDIKNFIMAISGYIDTEKSDLAKAKIEEFYGKIPDLQKIYTENAAINALIKSKMQKISDEIPENKFSIFIPEDLGVDEIDLCILLGNAIDNAIEANEKITDITKRRLSVKILHSNDQLSILIENSKESIQESPSLFFPTSKTNKFKHGFGIKNMVNIVDKYKGNIVFSESEDRFIVSILLPN